MDARDMISLILSACFVIKYGLKCCAPAESNATKPGPIPANAILYLIARNKKSNLLPITMHNGSLSTICKAVYNPSTNRVHAFCPNAKRYMTDSDAHTFDSVRQWGLYALGVERLSVKAKACVDERSIAWHEANGAVGGCF